jgi:two-component system, cell cycle response regulator DivK
VSAKGRILLVEDNELNRRLVRDLLVFRGHDVIEATTLAEARARVAPDLDVVLMDLQLPDGTGDEVLREMRADESLRHLPVLVVTASAMQGERERLLAAGFDAYLSKPIDTRTFPSVVESYLRGSSRTSRDAQGAHGS